MMKSRLSGIAVVLAAVLAACAPQQLQQDKGGAHVSVATSALHEFSGVVTLRIYTRSDFTGSATDIWNVGSDVYFAGAIVGNEQLFDSMPVGSYTVCAMATGGDNVTVYGPTCAKPVAVTKNMVASVNLVLQQEGNDGQETIDSPFITAITLSDGAPHFTEDVTISATVTGDAPLTYSWSFDCGSSSFSAQAATTVLSSTCQGTGHVTLTVSNGTGATHPGEIFSTVTFPLTYSPQGADVSVGLNRWPVIGGFHVAQAQLRPGESTFISVFASDDEPLTYAWSATCGTIDPTGVSVSDGNTNSFTAPSSTGDCTVTVAVTDGIGGKSTASVILHVGQGFLTAVPFAEVCGSNGCSPSSVSSSTVDPDGFHLSKPADAPGAAYNAGFTILGVAGLAFQSASFDTALPPSFAPGSPRLTLLYAGGSCALDKMPDPPLVGNTFTLTYPEASPYSYQVCPHIISNEPLTGAYFIIDGMGAAQTITLTNVKVNGIPVIQ